MTTILQLRQQEAEDSHEAGVWETTLDHEIVLNEGDEVSIKAVFLDTTVTDRTRISVVNDLEITMECAMYVQNYVLDQTYNYTGGESGTPGLGRLRTYQNYANSEEPNDYGDNNLWWLSKAISNQATHTWSVPVVYWHALGPYNNFSYTHHMDVNFDFQNVDGTTGHTHFHIPTELAKRNKNATSVINVICAGNDTGPYFVMTTSEYDITNKGMVDGETIDWLSAAVKLGANDPIISLQTFPFTFTLPATTYTPEELATYITNSITKIDKNGIISDNYAEKVVTIPPTNMPKYFPMNTPFLTSVLQNYQDLKTAAESGGYTADQVFVNSSFVTDDPEGGLHYFTYPVQKMMEEEDDRDASEAPPLDRFIGTNQLALEYDEFERKLKFTTQHFPIYNLGTDDTTNDAIPCLTYNPGGAIPKQTTSGIATRYSGIAWTSLTAKDIVTGQYTNFWGDIGLTGCIIQPKQNRTMHYPTATDPLPASPNSFSIDVIEEGSRKNVTGAYAGLDIPVQKNNIYFNRPIREGYLGQADTYIGTELTTSIFANRTFNDPVAGEGYFLVTISNNFSQELVGGKQTRTLGTVQSIVNRYYSLDSFTSDQSQGSIPYVHKGESQMLSNFGVRILNPNLSVPDNLTLGGKNTIFLQITRAPTQE
jgi:hypothetical protein